jgi:hypothetical protein
VTATSTRVHEGLVRYASHRLPLTFLRAGAIQNGSVRPTLLDQLHDIFWGLSLEQFLDKGLVFDVLSL